MVEIVESGNILIVEDDPFEAEHLRLHLQQAGHLISDVVTSGEEAIARVNQGGIDLLVVDIVLSGEMDGIDAVQEINQAHDIPVIFLTSHVSDELLIRAERAKPFAYLLKPYRQREMEFMVNMSLVRARIERELAAQKQLAETELHQAHAIIQHTNEGIMVTDADNIILSVNPAFTRITGYQSSEIIGRKTSLLSSGKHGQSFYSGMWSSIQRYGHWQGEIWNRHKNGEVFPEWLTINAIYDADGSLSQYVGIFSDITSIKQSEAEKERLQRELSQAHKMEALGQLAGGIAHDFNNVLGIIMGYIDMALDRYSHEAPEKMVAYLETAMKASERGKDLVAQMLTFNRSDNWDERPLQFAPLIKDNLKMLQSILPSSIKIKLNCEDDLPSIVMDPAKLQQLIMNLCINAKDAMEGAGILTINLGWQRGINRECACCHKWIKGSWVELSVTDTGSGMTAEILEHLFEPFYTTKAVGKGTGMGMSVLHGIVSGHGGHSLVETELGKGTTIRLLFPPAVAEAPGMPDSDQSLDVLLHGAGRHILVVDDEPMLAEYISDLLELHGYQPTIKTDSMQALKLFQEEPDKFALLVTDQTMPGLTGLELINQLREIRPEFPVILCSGFSENINAHDAKIMGIRYLAKPVKVDRLLHSAAELLGLTVK